MNTSQHRIKAFDSTLETTHRWLNELMTIAGLDNESQAYSVLRVVLHALRNRLPVDEAVQLGAEMPMLIRGFYFEGWKPALTPKKQRSLKDFIEGMEPFPKLHGALGPREAIEYVFKLIDHRISAGEIADVRHAMPAEIRELWPLH